MYLVVLLTYFANQLSGLPEHNRRYTICLNSKKQFTKRRTRGSTRYTICLNSKKQFTKRRTRGSTILYIAIYKRYMSEFQKRSTKRRQEALLLLRQVLDLVVFLYKNQYAKLIYCIADLDQ
ncbi:hypothetical protein C2G38_2036311 [Gigaspora rosea]|uniref:Uncharacterized protein n=1 Tax=Gigaspora rosea TaxID=44941 RepID=A0A397V9K1_9GLOM|nr:hypothetical protein C2G38_2036311 [Gigaspora rosea]